MSFPIAPFFCVGLSVSSQTPSSMSPAMPLETGAELRVGAGVAHYASSAGAAIWPAILLSGRYAATPNLELGLPLIVTLSETIPIAWSPRLAASAGIIGVGGGAFRNTVFAFITPSADVSVHLANSKAASFFAAGVRTGALGTSFADPSPLVFGRAGWMLALNDRLAVGVACEVSTLAYDLSEDARGIVHIVIGSPNNGPHSTVPAVRYQIAAELFLDGWFWLEATEFHSSSSAFSGLSAVAGALSLTWTP